MHLKEKLNLMGKLIQKKEGILLDYIILNKGIECSKADLYNKWEDYAQQSTFDTKFYVHLPFCTSKCTYCMYDSIVYTNEEQIDEYIDSVIKFLDQYVDLFKNKEFNGIYVGGGTPSLLKTEKLQRLFSYIFENFKFKNNYYKEIELNPHSTTKGKLKTLRELGFNRISLGVQSLKKSTLEKENRSYVGKNDINELVSYAKGIGFEDINLDLIVGLNNEQEEDVLSNLQKVGTIKPYSITVYTILKNMKQSVLYKTTQEEFYKTVDELYKKILNKSDILDIYNKEEWSNVLGFTLKLKTQKFEKLYYDAHNENVESLFSVGYKSFGKIWGVGMYETKKFGKENIFSFKNSGLKQEFFSAFLQSFQFNVDKKEFVDKFGIDVSDYYREELDYLLSNEMVKETKDEIIYIGDKSLIGYYGLLFLDLKNLIKFIKYRFYEKR